MNKNDLSNSVLSFALYCAVATGWMHLLYEKAQEGDICFVLGALFMVGLFMRKAYVAINTYIDIKKGK